MRPAVLLLCLAILALGLWLTRTAESPRSVVPPPSTSEPPAEGLQARAESGESTVPAAERRADVGAATAPADEDPAPALFRGRVVAVDRSPLAGCEVTLKCLPSAKGQPAPDTLTLEARTDARGAFELACALVAERWFSLRIERAGFAALRAYWRELEAGSTHDLGEVVMERGADVTGIVVDRDGEPQVGVRVSLSMLLAFPPGVAGPDSQHATQTRAGGAFALAAPVHAGTWFVGVADRLVETPRSVLVPPGGGAVDVHLVVAPAAELQTIRGKVVDQLGAPVPGAGVSALGSASAITDADGRFRIVRTRGDAQDDRVGLHAQREGYESTTSAKAYAWGTDDVVLVLHRKPGVEVRVLRESNGAPVEDFGLRVFPEPRSSVLPSEILRVRDRGQHAGGVARLDDLDRGLHYVWIETPERALLQRELLALEVGEAGAPRHEIAVGPAARRTLHVLGHDGAPVVGTWVELREPRGFLAVAHGETDVRGELELTAHGLMRGALHVLGPGHPPEVLDGVALAEVDEPFVVRIARGATITGRVEPAALAAQLWREAGLGGDATPERVRVAAPWVALRRAGDGSTYPVRGERPRIERDGRFRVAGVPAGTWHVIVHGMRARSPGGQDRLSAAAATVEALRDGEEREIVARVDALVTLRGRVLLDDAPFAGWIYLTGDHGPGAEQAQTRSMQLTDGDGRFEITAEAATWTLSAGVQTPDVGWQQLPAEASVRVSAGVPVDAQFRVRTPR